MATVLTPESVAPAPPPSPPVTARPIVRGKFLYAGAEKFWVKGVTYGTFQPDERGDEYGAPAQVEQDFARMAANGFNVVRTYTAPPRWLLDCAERFGLRVMVGLAWEQHIAFLDNRGRRRAILERVRAGVRACAGHPAVLCYAVGNEIPAPIVRWHGRRAIERFIRRLYRIAKREDPAGLVTYVNYPTTEYLQLPFLDLHCWNVYLESRERLDAYLARLQNLAGERPLLLAEIGLDSRRHGEQAQADSLAWQVRTAFAAGCAGAVVFAWTDQWRRGGYDIDDWDFGLTTRDRRPKPALESVRQAFAAVPFPADAAWPRISVVVCSYNGARAIRDTLDGVTRLAYPNFEVIVVNDGSTDDTPRIAADYPCRLISTENRGLSSARNTGWRAAEGELVAYIDDDAYPDPHWLHYLAYAFMTTDCVGVGGPNLAPPGDGPIADCIANAPGGPVQVLLSDREAEHIPGCNMAFRREALAAIDGFDSRYRAAGDDVDICWRLQDQGGKIRFHAGAMDWHHRRNSIRMYWRQQQGYGKAEALLEEKWPEKYNVLGHLTWSGRLYGKGLTAMLPSGRWRVYQGSWGAALFQSIYQPAAGWLVSLSLMPEWYLVIALLGFLSLLGLAWPPLLLVAPLFIMALLAPLAQAILSATRADFPTPRPRRAERLKLYVITALLHLLQPLARLLGRLRHGLSPWRRRGVRAAWRVRPVRATLWREQWLEPTALLQRLWRRLRDDGAVARRGGDYDRWDLELRGGLLGGARLLTTVEEHGAGRQQFRFRLWPRFNNVASVVIAALAAIAIAAGWDGAWLAAVPVGALALWLAGRMLADAGAAMTALQAAVRQLDHG